MKLTEFEEAMFDGQNNLASGSSVSSPFMHLSKNVGMHSMGETRRGERGTFVARLDLKRLLQAMRLGPAHCEVTQELRKKAPIVYSIVQYSTRKASIFHVSGSCSTVVVQYLSLIHL